MEADCAVVQVHQLAAGIECAVALQPNEDIAILQKQT